MESKLDMTATVERIERSSKNQIETYELTIKDMESDLEDTRRQLGNLKSQEFKLKKLNETLNKGQSESLQYRSHRTRGPKTI